MAFTSISYLLFLLITLTCVLCIPSKAKNPALLLSSWIFYLFAGHPGYILFLWLGTLFAYGFGFFIETCTAKKERLAVLWLAIAVQISALLFFKYSGLFTDIFARWGKESGLLYTAESNGVFSLIAPLGISYYTFSTVGYLVDIYQGKISAERNFIKYALFVSFFPQITVGPIPRADKLLPQLNGDYHFNYSRSVSALQLMLVGFFKKIALADMLGMFLNVLYADVSAQSGLTIFFMSLCYTFFIYCDFSGYCDIAMGSARLLGIELTQNFDTPLFSTSISEFWRRWHISLSTWLRDYVYFPLGGSRCKLPRHCLNLTIVFLLSGVWHGAGLRFIIWGLLFALFQLADLLPQKLLKRKKKATLSPVSKVIRNCIVYYLLSFTFIFFRVPSLTDCFYMVSHQFSGWSLSAFARDFLSAVSSGFNSTPLFIFSYLLFCMLASALLIYLDSYRCFRLHNQDISMFFVQKKTWVRWMFYYLLLAFIFAAFLMNNGYYGSSVSTSYAGF